MMDEFYFVMQSVETDSGAISFKTEKSCLI
jgi:hypothetical protein